MNVHSLGQLVMLAPASPRTLALIPPSNQALNQMVSQPFIVNLVYNSRTSCHHPQEDLLLLLLGAAVQSEQKQVKYNQLKGCPHFKKVQFFLNIVQKAFVPPPPFI